MNWDRIAGNWKQMKGAVKEQWGKLTDDEFDMISRATEAGATKRAASAALFQRA